MVQIANKSHLQIWGIRTMSAENTLLPYGQRNTTESLLPPISSILRPSPAGPLPASPKPPKAPSSPIQEPPVDLPPPLMLHKVSRPVTRRAKKCKKLLLNLVCHNCRTRQTPEWRRGPEGPNTLCNACGLYYSKQLRRKQQEDAASKELISAYLDFITNRVDS